MGPKPAIRDQEETAFSAILQRLLLAIPGAVGAVLVDEFGESVDYAGRLDPFDIRVAGAHWQLELRTANERLGSSTGRVQSLTVTAARRSYFAKRVMDEYVLVVILVGGSPFDISWRALYQTERDLRIEAGFDPPEDIDQWVLVEVDARPFDHWRPHAVKVDVHWVATEVIGAVVGLRTGERGYRVRLASGGKEITLIREVSGLWFADGQP